MENYRLRALTGMDPAVPVGAFGAAPHQSQQTGRYEWRAIQRLDRPTAESSQWNALAVFLTARLAQAGTGTRSPSIGLSSSQQAKFSHQHAAAMRLCQNSPTFGCTSRGAPLARTIQVWVA